MHEPQRTEINILRNKIAWAKQASVFEKSAAVESAIHYAVSVLETIEARVQVLEDAK